MVIKKPTEKSEVSITKIELTEVKFHIVGESPLVPHAVSFKARGVLLYPPKKKNQAEKDSTMKHDPYGEYRDAAYKFTDDQATRLYMPSSAFHGAMANAALDMVGAKKSQIGRLTTILGDKVPVWGVPKIYSTIVRTQDMARTPDVRTLPIIEKWCCSITVRFVASLIKNASIANLLGAAGVIVGVGDGRPEKGKLNYGRFRVCDENDAEFQAIVKFGGRKAQDAALADPAFYDLETEQLLSWFVEEEGRRHASPAKDPKVTPKHVVAAAKNKKHPLHEDVWSRPSKPRNGGKEGRP